MNQTRFDAFVAALPKARSRRSLLAAAGAAVLGLRAALVPAGGARGKTCPRKQICGKDCCNKGERCIAGICGVRCTFTTVDSTMTLDRNCVATRNITVPNGVTLDGGGKRITLAGKQNAPPVILVTEGYGQVRRLKLDARRLTGTCSSSEDLIQFLDSSGGIEDVSIRGLRCGTGIIARADMADQSITISYTSIETTGGFGLYLVGNIGTDTGRLYANVLNTTIEGIGRNSVRTGIYLLYNAEALVRNVVITAENTGIYSYGKTVLTAEDNTINRAATGIAAFDARNPDVSLTATGNRITGPGAAAIDGIAIDETVSADITNNAVSNYLSGPGGRPCGIRIAAGNRPVTLSDNTFPDPPGNAEDICDLRA